MKHIVKREGHEEHFDERKVYASCYAACLSAHVPHRRAEDMCDIVTRKTQRWITSKKEVTSHQISRQVRMYLRALNKEAAFMYETHKDIS